MAWGDSEAGSTGMHHYSAHALFQCVGGFFAVLFWMKKVTGLEVTPPTLAVAVCCPLSSPSKVAEPPFADLLVPSTVMVSSSPGCRPGVLEALTVTVSVFQRVA